MKYTFKKVQSIVSLEIYRTSVQIKLLQCIKIKLINTSNDDEHTISSQTRRKLNELNERNTTGQNYIHLCYFMIGLQDDDFLLDRSTK